jgi:tripartite-type tricarboxylate transporter receptor subunit TctC
MLRLILGVVAALGAIVLGAGAGMAQVYPSKPVRLVVGYSAGGGNDMIARIVAERLQVMLGQPFIIDNKPGNQSMIAAEFVAKAPPDGYTLLMAPSGPLTINPAVYARLSYSPEKDFAPISLLGSFPLMLVVGADQPFKAVHDLVAYGRANPGKATYASGATPFQLATELFNQRTGTRFLHVPFPGSGEAAQAVADGKVLMTIADSGALTPLLKSGKLRGLAITSPKRNPGFLDVPTMEEAGIRDLQVSLWTGIVAPAATPAAIITRLNNAIHTALAMPEVQAALNKLAVEPRHTSPDEYRTMIVRDTLRWKAVANTANIRLE